MYDDSAIIQKIRSKNNRFLKPTNYFYFYVVLNGHLKFQILTIKATCIKLY